MPIEVLVNSSITLAVALIYFNCCATVLLVTKPPPGSKPRHSEVFSGRQVYKCFYNCWTSIGWKGKNEFKD